VWNFPGRNSLYYNQYNLSHQHHTHLTDDELLQRYQQSKDNDWLGYLLQRYTMLLLGVAMKYLKEKESAEDAVQHIFFKALTQFPEGEVQNFKGWLYVLMRNHCFQLLRNRTYNVPEEILQYQPAPEESKEEQQQREYTLDKMEGALQYLNEEQRQTIELFYLQKLSYQQIMDRTGYSYMQVKSFIQNGKRNLKLILTKNPGNQL